MVLLVAEAATMELVCQHINVFPLPFGDRLYRDPRTRPPNFYQLEKYFA